MNWHPVKLLTLLLVAQGLGSPLCCQAPAFPIQTWAEGLSAKNDGGQKKFLAAVFPAIEKLDSAAAMALISKITESRPSGNPYLNARILMLKGLYFQNRLPAAGMQINDFYAKALDQAYIAADKEFIGFTSWQYGLVMYDRQELELAATYLLIAAENSRTILSPTRHDEETAYNLRFISSALFRARLFDKSIQYARQYLAQFGGRSNRNRRQIINVWNTLGQVYQKKGNLDSALFCFQRSATLAHDAGDQAWQGINAGHIGQVYFLRKEYARAKPLLWFDYHINREKDANIAANSLHWLGRIDQAEGQMDSAFWKLKMALQMLGQSTAYSLQNREYREATYYALTDAFARSGPPDSFHHYLHQYLSLHDSMALITARSSIDLAQMRFENGKNYYAVQLLEQQKRTEELTRNYIIAAILVLCTLVILVLVKQKQQLQYRQQLVLQQKETAEAEAAAATEQLDLFTRHLLEKTHLIETLQEQLHTRQVTAEQSEVMQQLSVQTILTEEDWLRFQRLFEKVHGGFFARLKEKAPGITAAEQRMAALTRLQFSNAQVAAMLGISSDSVRKTRQRLRNRLSLPVEAGLEETLASI
jgi:hypothetical protein